LYWCCWTATVLHDIPERFQIEMPDLKANPDLAFQLQKQIIEMAGVRSAKANPLTGSLVVHYDCSDDARERILSTLNATPRTHISPRPSIDIGSKITETLYDRLMILQSGQPCGRSSERCYIIR
jgi:hypothetical protein